ncbi:hypothetical protein EVAR_59731_1 [Eumeta japonica]|uniref:Uncharacterized protein n=1 Tax=Eumeta variegata TaxID=151549 RepID=A0A4C1XJJ9_EUMVA|nr:hypothetical protein EVAR_59731_1 [Eumeta japonica]
MIGPLTVREAFPILRYAFIQNTLYFCSKQIIVTHQLTPCVCLQFRLRRDRVNANIKMKFGLYFSGMPRWAGANQNRQKIGVRVIENKLTDGLRRGAGGGGGDSKKSFQASLSLFAFILDCVSARCIANHVRRFRLRGYRRRPLANEPRRELHSSQKPKYLSDVPLNKGEALHRRGSRETSPHRWMYSQRQFAFRIRRVETWRAAGAKL